MTLEQAQARLDAYLAAELAVLGGQEYEIDTGGGRRRLRRADLAEIRKGIVETSALVAQLTALGSGGRRRVSYVVAK